MCGLVALLGAPQTDAKGRDAMERIASGLSALAHRGPDGSGEWSDGRCALGHRRLATVAPSDGAQPIANEDGTIVAVVTGEFYGDQRLRAELEARGHRFRTSSDSELLVHLYEERGVKAADDLEGEYAFLVWDQRNKCLLAGRDPFGVRPLLFADQGHGTAFASEAKALFAMGVEGAWDREMLGVGLSLQYPLPGRTMFRGVREIEAGERRLFGENGQSSHVVRAFSAPAPTEVDLPFKDHAVRTIDALRTATQRRLRGDAPVCALLSGGLDSTATAALAQEAMRQPLTAYTVRFRGGGDHDEADLAAQSARTLGLDHRVVDLDTTALLDALPDAVAHGEGFAINHHIAAKSLLMRTIRADGFRVALTGEGADEVFLGYAHLLSDAAGALSPTATQANRASAGLMLPAGEELDLSPVASVLDHVPTWLRAKASVGARVRTLLRPGVRAALEASRPIERAASAFGLLPFALDSRPERSAESWSTLALATYILKTLGDSMELAHSVEGRLPFLDRDVVRAACAAPVRHKLKDGEPKALLREALRGVVPDDVRVRRKHPFLAPAPEHRVHAAFLEAQLEHDAFGPGGPFNPDALRARIRLLADASPAEQTSWVPPLMLTMSVAWLNARYQLGAADLGHGPWSSGA